MPTSAPTEDLRAGVRQERDVRQLLLEFANTNRFGDAHVTAIGAFSEVTLGYFDPANEGLQEDPGQGTGGGALVFWQHGAGGRKTELHAHVVVGKSDGTAHGGHFLDGKVWPTLEMVLTELPVNLRRARDEETGLALIRLAA